MKPRHALLEATFAAARRHLEKARVAQDKAIVWGIGIYKAGRIGAAARAQAAHWDRERAAHRDEALRIRRCIHQLRAELARLERADTQPPKRDDLVAPA